MEQLHIEISGKIQGVGFRPYLVKLARQLDLAGYAMNTSNGLSISVAGESQLLETFLTQLQLNPPRHARIHTLNIHRQTCDIASVTEMQGKPFGIRTQNQADIPTLLPASPIIPADRALCRDCLTELFDPDNRRYLHPFISCIECGPRASCIRELPFERHNTSFADFDMCPECLQESQEMRLSTRRFHAQTNACHDCGPTLSLYRLPPDAKPEKLENPDDKYFPVTWLAERIRAGDIVAIKGVSGMHLLADARQPEVVARMRRIKQRPAKAFAIMALNSATADNYVEMNALSKEQLESCAAPIMLLPLKNRHSSALSGQSVSELADTLAPGLADLGIMLPNTALHYLLFHALLNRPEGTDWLQQPQTSLLLVTSANLPGEPIISDNQDALIDLGNIADGLLVHNREIVFASDDSVLQSSNAGLPGLMIRRARGFAPEPLPLHTALRKQTSGTILACGAYLKNTFSILRGEEIIPSTHLGEQNSRRACLHFEQHIDAYQQRFDVRPDAFACDLHPDFFSSRYAESHALSDSLPLIKVAHHKAHIASVFNECDLSENTPFLALALDGLGLGDVDSPIQTERSRHRLWGGELYTGCLNRNMDNALQLALTHLAHLSTLSLPGGDIASREICRIGYALQAHLNLSTHNRFEDFSTMPAAVKTFIKTRIQHTENPASAFEQSSALGRWFDGIASLLGICQHASYEGQAAMALEALARTSHPLPEACQTARIESDGTLNLYPVLPTLLTSADPAEAAARFHSELVDGLIRWIKWARHDDIKDILCSGGCFQNRILREHLDLHARKVGLRVHFPAQIPVNDGSISIGQAVLACLQTFSR
jgi:hydrogenase maturation protein HypF